MDSNLETFIQTIAALPEQQILMRAGDREFLERRFNRKLEELHSYRDEVFLEKEISKLENRIIGLRGEIKLILRIGTHIHGKTFVSKDLERFMEE